MICIHSRRDFRPNNVNGCWNGANEVKYAAINAGPRFYNAFSSHVQGKAGTASLKRTSETGKILSVAKCVIYRITRLSKLGSGSGATIETRRAWRSPRLPLSVDTLVDPPISTKLIPRAPFSWDPMVTPWIPCPARLLLIFTIQPSSPRLTTGEGPNVPAGLKGFCI